MAPNSFSSSPENAMSTFSEELAEAMKLTPEQALNLLLEEAPEQLHDISVQEAKSLEATLLRWMFAYREAVRTALGHLSVNDPKGATEVLEALQQRPLNKFPPFSWLK